MRDLEKLERRCKTEKTLENYKRCIEQFYRWSPASELTRDCIEEYVDYLVEKGYKPSTINVAACALKKLLEIKEGVRVKITNIPKITQEIPEVINEDEAKIIIERIYDTRDKTIIALLYDCALRNSELVNLNVEDINLEERTVFLRNRKGGLAQVIPFGERTKEIIEGFIKERKKRGFTQDALFPAFKERIDTTTIIEVVKRYSERYLGKKGITPHSLRHSRAMALRKKGVSLDKIREFLGHTDLKTTLIYARMEPAELKKLPEAFTR